MPNSPKHLKRTATPPDLARVLEEEYAKKYPQHPLENHKPEKASALVAAKPNPQS